MYDKEETIREAEAFVRRALSHFSDAKADDDAIKSAALKVSRSMRFSQNKESRGLLR